MLKKTAYCFSSLFLPIFLFLPTIAAAETVRIGWVFAMANAPLIIAEQQGYFKDEGLDVKAVSFASGPLVHRALNAGELDIAYIGTPPVYHWAARGLESKIIAKINYGQAAVIAHQKSKIVSVKELNGKRMAGVRKGSGMDVLLRGYVLGKAGLVPDRDVQIKPMRPADMGKFVEGRMVDAAFIWEPFTSLSLLRGHTKLIFDMNQAAPNYPWYVIMTPAATLQSKRVTLLKVLKAHKRAVAYLNSKEDAGNEIIAGAFKLAEITDTEGKKHSPLEIVKSARQRLGWEWDIKQADMDFIQQLMNYSYDLRYIRKPMKVEEVVDKSLLAEIEG